MKIGIVGLPNVGKSTLFNALTKSYAADAANFPFCTIDPNIGIVDVKDPRVDKLSEISNSAKKIYSHIEFVDIAGLVRGAGKGEGLGNKFLSHIREVDAIVQVLRYFKDPDVVHVEGGVDPLRDKQIINDELIFSDLEQVERILPQLSKKAQSTGDKFLKQEVAILTKIKETLDSGQMAHKAGISETDQKMIKNYNLLSIKPIIYAFNIDQDEIGDAKKIQAEFSEKLQEPVAIVCAKIESELMDMEDEEKKQFIAELHDIEHSHIPVLDDLISLAFKTVGLSYYFTTGPKETKAWTIPINSTAPQAAGKIHTDFEKGFIKAEIVSFDDLIAAGTRTAAKEKGKVRLEGKNYIVQDGDIIIFKFNV